MTDKQIFQFIGLIYLAVGVGILLNPQYYKKMFADFKTSTAVMYIGGIFAFAIGFLLIIFHNIWVKDISVIITIVGWMALLKGISILVLPKLMMKTMDIFINVKATTLRIMAACIIVAGALLTYVGFCCT
ncbi:MAG: DUF2065 family protein [Planctomycetes bacterium]|nr:DUF2065 family protein [Planctomycetota bacterium]